LDKGWLKLNWNAALDVSQKKMGVGVVVRDDSGTVKAMVAKVVPFIVDPTLAEAMAAWQAVQFCCDMGFQRVVLVGNSLTIISTLR
jgi:phosphotransferase system IIA component